MKTVTALVMAALAGCANSPYRSATYEQLDAVKVTNQNCARIDHHVNFLEEQLRMKGLSTATPENLNEADRKYNATVRSMIWSLRIGCSNPDRYRS
jgi:hypothetical protein